MPFKGHVVISLINVRVLVVFLYSNLIISHPHTPAPGDTSKHVHNSIVCISTTKMSIKRVMEKQATLITVEYDLPVRTNTAQLHTPKQNHVIDTIASWWWTELQPLTAVLQTHALPGPREARGKFPTSGFPTQPPDPL
ncbi:hypothetical protein HJG60_008220 [Phyllostomus discolor]|uniref:Uncharacterized protein n=1 Tax=Phyllostomus discolor TaxID=89673 RepID=A0A834DLY8_9CHIR|nr:hypothetical protein HJG60_008220 [Phyllostomus discolor]